MCFIRSEICCAVVYDHHMTYMYMYVFIFIFFRSEKIQELSGKFVARSAQGNEK